MGGSIWKSCIYEGLHTSVIKSQATQLKNWQMISGVAPPEKTDRWGTGTAKKYSRSSTIREMQSSTMEFHRTPTRTRYLNQKDTQSQEVTLVGKLKFSHPSGSVKRCRHIGEYAGGFFKSFLLNTEPPQNPAGPLPAVYPRGVKACVHRKPCTQMFTQASLTTVKK